MDSRTILFLIIFLFCTKPIFASECLKCHQPHYQEVGTCSSCHRGNEDTSRKNIAHNGIILPEFADFKINTKATESGRKIVEKAHCRRCHIIDGKGNDIAPNIDIESRRKSTDELFEKISDPSEYMPEFNLNKNNINNVIKMLLASGDNKDKLSNTAPFIVFITSGTKSTFEDKCGGCHRLLSKSKGGMGHGNTAPNLSGLFTEFYPQQTVIKDKWDKELILKWIKNPRSLNRLSVMPTQNLTEAEEKKIIEELSN